MTVPFFISPPFGSYLQFRNATSIEGSYTWDPRPGLALQVIKFFWENFRHPVAGGWVNRIGLRNPGFHHAKLTNRSMISLVGLNAGDWETMFWDAIMRSDSLHKPRFELNLGCPNVHEYGIEMVDLQRWCEQFWCSVKLPADLERALKIADMAVRAGAACLHAGNTFSTPIGGISGTQLLHINLAICEALVKRYPDTPIIGGGGIYTWEDLCRYRDVGVWSYSLATICFRPWRARALIRQYEQEYGLFPV